MPRDGKTFALVKQAGRDKTLSTVRVLPSVVAHLDFVTEAGEVQGWFVKREPDHESLPVQVQVDGAPVPELGQIQADQPRPGVAQHYKLPHNRLGFAFDLPQRFFDGQPHELQLSVDPAANVTLKHRFALPAPQVTPTAEDFAASGPFAFNRDRSTGQYQRETIERGTEDFKNLFTCDSKYKTIPRLCLENYKGRYTRCGGGQCMVYQGDGVWPPAVFNNGPVRSGNPADAAAQGG